MMFDVILSAMISFLFLLGIISLVEKKEILKDKKYGEIKYSLGLIFMFSSVFFAMLLVIWT